MVREGSFYLRVKIKSLDEEVRIIRHEMRKVKKSWNYFAEKATATEDVSVKADLNAEAMRFDWVDTQLILHMSNVVKTELRSSLIALAFLKGKPYSSVERFTRKSPDWARIERLVKKYYPLRFYNDPWPRPEELDKMWAAWLQEAKEYIYITGGCQPHLKEAGASVGMEERREKLEQCKVKGETLYKYPYGYVYGPVNKIAVAIPPAEKVNPQSESPKGFLARVGNLFA